MTQPTPGLPWLIQLLSVERLNLGDLVKLGRLLPRDPKWARRVAPLLTPGLLRGALTAYGHPRKMATALAFAGGVTLLESLRARSAQEAAEGIGCPGSLEAPEARSAQQQHRKVAGPQQ